MIKKMNGKERKEPPKIRAVEKGGPTVPLGREMKLKVGLEDGTMFRHSKKEGIHPFHKNNRRKCVRVQKQARDSISGRKSHVSRYFYYGTATEHRVALATAVRFRDGLWAEAAAGKSMGELKKWATDWKEESSEGPGS